MAREEWAGSASTPMQAKRLRQWWLRPAYSKEMGVAVRLDSDPILFSEIFPGYQPPSDSRNFWRRYFSYPFDLDVRADRLAAREDALIPTPWLGCPELYRDQGADLIFLGTSESYRAMHLPTYAAQFPKTRILNCGRSSLLPVPALKMAETLRSMQKAKSQAIVLAYSLWWAYPEENGKSRLEAEQLDEMSLWRNTEDSALRKLWFLDGETLFGKLSWDDLFPRASRQVLQPTEFGPVPDFRRGELFQGMQDRNVFVYRSEVGRLGKDLIPKPYYRMVKNGTPAQCGNLALAREELLALVNVARDLAQHVYLYTPPITPSGEENFAPCFREFTRKLFAELESPTVHVRSETWESYGLDWHDFVYPTENPEVVRTDFNHANDRGSRKVSKVLAEWIAREWPKGNLSE